MSRICSDLPRHVLGCQAGEPGNLGVLLRAVFIASSRRSLSVPKPAKQAAISTWVVLPFTRHMDYYLRIADDPVKSAVLAIPRVARFLSNDSGLLNFSFERFIQTARMCRDQPSPKDPGGIDESIDLSRDR